MTAALQRLVGFGRALRHRGLPVGTGRILAFCRAVEVLRPTRREPLYWAARSSLVSDLRHVPTFDETFDAYFSRAVIEEIAAAAGSQATRKADRDDDAAAIDLTDTPSSWILPDERAETEGEVAVGVVASSTEVLRERSFDDLSDDELAEVSALIRQLAVASPRRAARRTRPATRGDRFDLRRTLRGSLRTQGEPIHRAWRKRGTRARPLVLLLDVSGSMTPYAGALLQFGFAAIAAGHKVEVFCFGTRLTRITRSLAGRDPNHALRKVSEIVHDREGGTRIGDSLKQLLDTYGQHGFLRGAVVVLCSDGLERGDPQVLAGAMRRINRLAHRLVWVNPLKGSPQYQPLARGMAAALPHVDVFLPGHNLASLEALGSILDG